MLRQIFLQSISHSEHYWYHWDSNVIVWQQSEAKATPPERIKAISSAFRAAVLPLYYKEVLMFFLFLRLMSEEGALLTWHSWWEVLVILSGYNMSKIWLFSRKEPYYCIFMKFFHHSELNDGDQSVMQTWLALILTKFYHPFSLWHK